MERIVVVGAGPVGLATADRLARAGWAVTLVAPRRATAGERAAAGELGPPESFHAAAAFWTPFSSGMTPAMERQRSGRTLEFYEQFRAGGAFESADAGVVWRPVEQYWERGTAHEVPAWAEHPQLQLERRPFGDAFDCTADGALAWRCELRYTAPVIQVDKFRRWYLDALATRGVELVLDWPHLLSRRGADGHAAGAGAWRKLLGERAAAAIVVCAGVGTVYQGLVGDDAIPPQAIAFKKGVTALLSASPGDDEPVQSYKGAAFESDGVLLCPRRDGYVIGGTVHAVGRSLSASEWTATDDEKAGILERAAQILPAASREKLARSGLWARDQDTRLAWRVGIRPLLADHGPFVGPLAQLSDELAAALGRPMPALAHFGHGGSGFTTCQDTAAELVEVLRDTLG